MAEKEIYISAVVECKIEGALYSKDVVKRNERKKELAETLFDGNMADLEGLLKLCSTEKMQMLLEEIGYWDSPAGDIYHMWKYYDYCLPLLKEYTEKTGYILRWKAYNEEFGLPVPEDDVVEWKSASDVQSDGELAEVNDTDLPF